MNKWLPAFSGLEGTLVDLEVEIAWLQKCLQMLESTVLNVHAFALSLKSLKIKFMSIHLPCSRIIILCF